MPDPYRDDEMPEDYVNLRNRAYGRSPRSDNPFRLPALPSIGGMMRGAQRRVGGAADDVSARAKALRRVLSHLLTGR